MEHHEVLIVGGGNAGISLAARLLRDGAQDVAVVESESVHRYRPLLNYVGAGEATMASLERPAATVMPDECTWIQDQVVAFDAEGPSVLTRDGRRIGCTTLVLCTGLEEDWDATPGLAEARNRAECLPPVCRPHQSRSRPHRRTSGALTQNLPRHGAESASRPKRRGRAQPTQTPSSHAEASTPAYRARSWPLDSTHESEL